MARVKISAVYDSFARDDQPPILVVTEGPNGERYESVLLTGEGKEFDVESIRGISLSQPSDPSRANELTKPVSDMSVVRPVPEGSVAETRPVKPVGEQSGLEPGKLEKTAPADNPGGPQPNVSAKQPGASPAGMRNSLGISGAPAETRDPAEVQRHPTDPLSLLK